MSAIPSVRAVRPPRINRPPFDPSTLSPMPTIKGLDAAVDFVRSPVPDGLGVPAITRTRLRAASEHREVEVFLISGAYYFSEHGLYSWLMSLRLGGDAA
jgi:hypothetical protein